MVILEYNYVLNRLSPHDWKSARTIAREAAQDMKIDYERVNLVRLYPLLRKIERDGLANSRDSYEDGARVKLRGGRPVVEYILTGAGIKRRHELGHSCHEGLEGIVWPENA